MSTRLMLRRAPSRCLFQPSKTYGQKIHVLASLRVHKHNSRVAHHFSICKLRSYFKFELAELLNFRKARKEAANPSREHGAWDAPLVAYFDRLLWVHDFSLAGDSDLFLDFSASAISVSAPLNVLRNVLGNENKSAQLKGVLVFEQRFLSE